MTGRDDDDAEANPTSDDDAHPDSGGVDGEIESNGEGVFGPFEDPGPIEPGDPSLENVLFVLLGILAGIAATLELLGIF